jgi:hypothetical protein
LIDLIVLILILIVIVIVVCSQEGPGACLFCGSAVLSKNASPEEIERVYASVREYKMSLKEREGLQKAEEHKNKLLEYEKNSTKRTLIYGNLHIPINRFFCFEKMID